MDGADEPHSSGPPLPDRTVCNVYVRGSEVWVRRGNGWVGKERQYVRARDEVARETRAWKCERSETIDMKVSNYFDLLRLAVPRRHAHVTGGHMGVSKFVLKTREPKLGSHDQI